MTSKLSVITPNSFPIDKKVLHRYQEQVCLQQGSIVQCLKYEFPFHFTFSLGFRSNSSAKMANNTVASGLLEEVVFCSKNARPWREWEMI